MSLFPTHFHGVDLFAGAGGLSLGAQLAGVNVTHAIESDRAAAQTYRQNHTGTVVIEQEVQAVSPPPKLKGKVHILFGGPPCQGFSTSNQRTRNADNPRNWLFSELIRFAELNQPDWIVLENVKGLRDTAKGQFDALIQSEFERLGYSADVWTLCAADFGVPQKRFRLFYVARRKGELPPAPSKTTRYELTVRDAIGDLPVLSVGANHANLRYRRMRPNAFAKEMRRHLKSCCGHLVTENNELVIERYKHIPPGGNWQDIPKSLMLNYTNMVDNRSRHTGIYRRLQWDQPSVVIANYRKNMLVHPEQDRGLSVREAARIQSFPDIYKFHGSIGFQQQQVSNAVPPNLAKAVFSQIIAYS